MDTCIVNALEAHAERKGEQSRELQYAKKLLPDANERQVARAR
jgi:hypothetical protein